MNAQPYDEIVEGQPIPSGTLLYRYMTTPIFVMPYAEGMENGQMAYTFIGEDVPVMVMALLNGGYWSARYVLGDPPTDFEKAWQIGKSFVSLRAEVLCRGCFPNLMNFKWKPQ